MTSIFSPDSSATTAWTRAPRWPTVAPTGSSPSWRDATATFERLPASRAIALISTVPLWISGTSSSNRRLRKPLWVRLTKICGPLRRAPDLEHERLDVLADPVVLERALLGRCARIASTFLPTSRMIAARLDPVDRAGDQLALAAGELVEDLVALDLADALEDDLLGGLGADPAEDVAVELLGLDEVADARRSASKALACSTVISVNSSSTSSTTRRARKTRILPVSASIRTWMSSSPATRR